MWYDTLWIHVLHEMIFCLQSCLLYHFSSFTGGVTSWIEELTGTNKQPPMCALLIFLYLPFEVFITLSGYPWEVNNSIRDDRQTIFPNHLQRKLYILFSSQDQHCRPPNCRWRLSIISHSCFITSFNQILYLEFIKADIHFIANSNGLSLCYCSFVM